MRRWLNPFHWAGGCCLGAVLLLVALLGGMLACGWLWAGRARAAGDLPLDLMLVVDNSQSCWPINGPGTDPDGLRLRAAQLAAEYLGVDTALTHRAGLIFFGTQPEQVVPSAPLDSAQRERLLEALGQAKPAGWTDTAAALTLAESSFTNDGTTRRAVFLFTDGTPYVEGRSQADLLADLAAVGAHYRERGILLSVVLLQRDPGDANPTLETFWRDLASGTGGRVIIATAADTLPALYHDLVADLLGRTTTASLAAVPVTDSAVTERQLPIPQTQGDVSVVVWTDAQVQAQLLAPDGTPHGQPQTGSGLLSWQLQRPPAGAWRVLLTATTPGVATIWADATALETTATPNETETVMVTATSSPTPTPSPTATFSRTATSTTTSTMTATPLPTLSATPSATVTATRLPAMTPTLTPPALVTPPSTPENSSGGGWLWLLPLGLVGAAGGWWWHTRQRDSAAFLSGTLIELPSGRRLSLDCLSQATMIGPLHLSADHDATGEPVTLVSADGLTIGDLPTTAPYALWDGDLITVGSQRWRYDNLTRRHRK